MSTRPHPFMVRLAAFALLAGPVGELPRLAFASGAGPVPSRVPARVKTPPAAAGTGGGAASGTPVPGPTGRTSREQNPRANAALIAAARSVRAALDANSEVARADLRVTAEDGRVVVQGWVASEELRGVVMREADAAAPTTHLDFVVAVRK